MPTLTRRRAQEFARAVDDGVRPSPALAPLVTLTRALPACRAEMNPDVRRQQRGSLLQLAAAQFADVTVPAQRTVSGQAGRKPDVRWLPGWLEGWHSPRRTAAVAGLAMALLAIVGVGVAGSRALPGDALYGVKRATEALKLSTTHGKIARAKQHFAFAEARLDEVAGLVGSDVGAIAARPGRPLAGAVAMRSSTTSLVRDALSDMDSETVAGTRDLTEAWQESHDQEPLTLLHQYSQAHFTRLAALVPEIPTEVRTNAEVSLKLLVSVSQQADRLPAPASASAPSQQTRELDAQLRQIVAASPVDAGPLPPVPPLPVVPPATDAPVAPASPSPDALPVPAPTPTPAESPADSSAESPAAEPTESSTPSPADSPSEVPSDPPTEPPISPPPTDPSTGLPSASPSPGESPPPSPQASDVPPSPSPTPSPS